MFKIAVEFLSGRCYAARWDNPSKAEWPVDSARHFSAMVAAVPRLGPNDRAAARRWLEWLEALSPPVVIAVEPPNDPPASFSFAVRPVVAVNQKIKAKVINPRTDRLQLTSTPLLDPVLMLEYAADLHEDDRPVVERLLANVTYVGSAESIVRMYLTDEAPHEKHVRYVPSGHREFIEKRRGLVTLRVPHAGRLAHLDAAYADLQRRDRRPFEPRALAQARPVPYTIVRPNQHLGNSAPVDADMNDVIPLVFVGRRDHELADHSHGNVRNRPDLDSGRFAVATSAVRRAFLSNLGDDAPEELSGHPVGKPDAPTQRDHVAFIPLAEVGFPNAKSRLRGVALVIPREFSSDLRERALKAFRFEYITIGSIAWRVENVLDPELTSLSPRRYRGSDKAWVTATPIVLPRYPRRREGPGEIVVRALADAGLPAPESIETSAIPFVEGAYPIALYRNVVPDNRYIAHARITFKVTVRGPILVGRYRHQGYGLCLPASMDGTLPSEAAS